MKRGRNAVQMSLLSHFVRVFSCIETSEVLRESLQKARQLQVIQEALQSHYPTLPLRASSLRGEGVLELLVPNGAWASRLRQLEPTLRAGLNGMFPLQENATGERVPLVCSIKVYPAKGAKARAELPKVLMQQVQREPISQKGLQSLQALLGEGVENQELAQALSDLLRRHSPK